MSDQCPACGRKYATYSEGHTPNSEVCLANQLHDLRGMTPRDAIQQEADECAKSAKDQRNTPEDREIFHVLSIVLGGIAKKLGAKRYRDGATERRPSSLET